MSKQSEAIDARSEMIHLHLPLRVAAVSFARSRPHSVRPAPLFFRNSRDCRASSGSLTAPPTRRRPSPRPFSAILAATPLAPRRAATVSLPRALAAPDDHPVQRERQPRRAADERALPPRRARDAARGGGGGRVGRPRARARRAPRPSRSREGRPRRRCTRRRRRTRPGWSSRPRARPRSSRPRATARAERRRLVSLRTLRQRIGTSYHARRPTRNPSPRGPTAPRRRRRRTRASAVEVER